MCRILSRFSIYLLFWSIAMIGCVPTSYAATFEGTSDLPRTTAKERHLTKEQTAKVLRQLNGNGDLSLKTIDQTFDIDVDKAISLVQTRSIIIEQLLERGDLSQNDEQGLMNMLEESNIYNIALKKYSDYVVQTARVGKFLEGNMFKNEEDYIHFMTSYAIAESLFSEFWSIKLWSLSISEESLNLCKSIKELHITLINIKQSVDAKRSKSLMDEVRDYVETRLNRISGKTYTEDIEKISVLFRAAILRAEAIPDGKSRAEFIAGLQTRLEILIAKRETFRIRLYQKKAVSRIQEAWLWWEKAEKEYKEKGTSDSFVSEWHNHLLELSGINAGYLGTDAQELLAEVKMALLSVAQSPIDLKAWMIDEAHTLKLEDF